MPSRRQRSPHPAATRSEPRELQPRASVRADNVGTGVLRTVGAAARGHIPAAEVLAAMFASRNNLPTPVDSFVGGQMELAEITGAVRADRVVTLTGPGGSGKTRLALEAGESLVPEFADGVWLVELGTISDSGRLPGTVAQVLGISDRPGEALGDTLAGWLRDRHLLLILTGTSRTEVSRQRTLEAVVA